VETNKDWWVNWTPWMWVCEGIIDVYMDDNFYLRNGQILHPRDHMMTKAQQKQIDATPVAVRNGDY
jgi:hypothetical protein